ncbi:MULTISPECIES: type VI secretion system Vgr family protein [Caballeronia]|uniref:Type VI secretion protein Vgr n=1 Tax=Caballeronia zhejiangensis TaxID=871203 RepID=A0A656QIV0_9BURK|nr:MULTISPECIES: type VI secretion system Vgr family protein [Caballeronia]KDR30401.1 type VI secretion protein Vgr [Caballeronia zhejiangensis]MDR5789667.1 type VI secretion system tip protein VgrG [Caballeronia sp. LP003]
MSMVLPSQAYGLQLKPHPAPISVLSFNGEAQISALYKFNIEFTSPVADIPMDQVVGRSAVLTIAPIDPQEAYLRQMFGERWKDFSKAPEPSVTHGVIDRFETLGTSTDETRYRVTLVPKIAELARGRTCRLFQKQSVVEIITDTLRHYDYRLGVDFDFKSLRGTYKRLEYETQFYETTFAFIQRLCAEAGIWFRFEQKSDRTVIIFGDDLDAYARKQRVVPYRSHSGLESVGAESIRSLRTITQRVPEAVQLNDYNHRQADVNLLVEENTARADKTTDGVDGTWGEHYETLEEGRQIARLRHEAHIATQISYRARGNPFSLEVGEVIRLDVNPKDAPNGLLVTSMRCGGGRGVSYWNTFRAIPADRKWRTSIDVIERPKAEGIWPARVDSPGNYHYGYLDEKGRYVVKMPFDLDEWSPGGASRPIRMAKPYAGADYGHHMPLIHGTEVALIFTAQDPNRPVIVGSLHDSLNPDLVNNLNNTRNLIRTAAKNELRMEDKENFEHIHLTTPYQTSELNLGHMVDGQRKERGRGAELRSDEHVAVRGGKGVLLSAEVQQNSNGQQLAMQDADTTLSQARDLLRSLNDSASTAKAWLAEVDQQRSLIEEKLTKLGRSVLVATAPDGIGVASGQQLQLASRKQMFVTSGEGLDFGALKRITAAAGEAISFFAAKLGIGLFAAKGKVQIQAQSDAMELLAMQGMVVSSSDGEVTITGRKGVTIGDGSGAYIKLMGGRIMLGSPSGEIEIKGDLTIADADGGSFTFPSWSSTPVQDMKNPISFGFSE